MSRREEILDAAARLLEEQGPEVLTMRELAARLGIQAPSLYKHIRDKDDIEAGLQERALVDMGNHLAGAGTSLLDIAGAYRSWARAHPRLYELATRRPLARDRLTPGVEAAAAAPIVRAAGGDEHRARALWALAHGLVDLELSDRFPPGADLDTTWRTALEAFGQRPEQGEPHGAPPTSPAPLPAGARPVAEGRSAVVYDLGDGTVLRRYRGHADDTAREAALIGLAREHGVPVPAVHRAEGRDLVMERVVGPTMLEDLLARPGAAAEHGATLAALHGLLDRVPFRVGHDAATGLVHGDLHPGNVILGPSGPVLIDWTNAGPGPRAVDVATTWLVLGCMDHPDVAAGALVEDLRPRLLEPFLARVDREAAAAALPTVAAVRLADPATTSAERSLITAFAATHGVVG